MRNAVLLAKSRQAKSISGNNANLTEAVDNGQSLEETVKRIKQDQKKFMYFWEGVKNGVNAHELKKKHERQSTKLEHHEVSITQKKAQWIFHPDNPMKIGWDLFLTFFVMYSVIVIPYRLGFDVAPTLRESRVDGFITALFGFDILVTLNTAHLDPKNEKYVFGRQLIATEYFKYWFWVDLFATIPFDMIANTFIDPEKVTAVRGVRILRLGRLAKLYRLLRKTNYMQRLHLSPAVVNMIFLMLQIFFIAHLLACCWHFIALPSAVGSFPTHWIKEFNYDHTTVGTKYIASLYFVIVTMLTVGYGDIHPTNQIERLFAILIMVVGGVIFGALVAKVTGIIDKRNPQQQAFNAKMKELKMFLADTGLPLEIRNRAKMAYAYYLSKKSSFSEMDIIEKLPTYIVTDLVMEMYAGDIDKIKLFKEAEPAFIVSLLPLCRPFEAQPEEVVFKEGDICNEIVFIKQGTVRILSNNGKKDILAGVITEGGMFGDSEYYRNTTSIATYSASKYCQFLSIGHATLSNILENHYSTSQSFNRFVKDRYFALMSVIRSRSDAEVDPRLYATLGKDSALNGMSFTNGGSGKFQGFSSPTKMLQRKFSHFDDSSVWNHTMPTYGRERSNARSRSDTLFLSTNASKRQSYATKRSICVDGLVCDLTTSMHHLDIDPTEAAFSLTGSTIRVVIVRNNKESVREYPMEVLKARKLVHPQGYYKLRWDFYIGFLIIYSVLVIPIEIAFSGNAFQNQFAWNTVIDICFFIDIGLCFRTCFMSDHLEAMVIDGSLIAKHYVSRWFIIDLFSSFPFDAILIAAGNEAAGENLAATQLFKTFRILRLLKLLRMFKLGLYVERIEDATGISPMVFQLLALLVQVFFVVHLACCLYWGLTDSVSSHPWYHEAVQKEDTIAARYLVALYFTFTTITTVGYGDLGPSKTAERMICIFLVLTGASVFGYMIANVSSVLGSLDSDGTSAEKMTEVTEYLNEKRCSPNLRFKIMNHFQKQYQDTTVYDVEQISNCLPPGLRTELLIALNDKRMSKIPIFKYISNQSVSLYLFKMMSPSYYEDGHYIIKEGNEAEDVIFLVNGHARAFKICKEPVKIVLPPMSFPDFPHHQLIHDHHLHHINHHQSESEHVHTHPKENGHVTLDEKVNGGSDHHIHFSRIRSEPVLFDASSANMIRDEISLEEHPVHSHIARSVDNSENVNVGLSHSDPHIAFASHGSALRGAAHEERGASRMQFDAVRRVSDVDSRQPADQSPERGLQPINRPPPLDMHPDAKKRSPKAKKANRFQLSNMFGSKSDLHESKVGEESDHSDGGSFEMTSIYAENKESESIPSKISPMSKMFGTSSFTSSKRSPHNSISKSTPNNQSSGYKAVSTNEDHTIELANINLTKSMVDISLEKQQSSSNSGIRSGPTGLWRDITGSTKQGSINSVRTDSNIGLSTAPRPKTKRFFSNKEDRRSIRVNSVDSMASIDTAGSRGSNKSNTIIPSRISISKLMSQKSFSVISSKKRVKTDNLDQLGKPFESLTDVDFLEHGYKLLGDVNPGDFVGHIAFMTADHLHDASVRTTVPSTVYTLSKTEIQKLIRIEPTVGIQLQAALTRATIAQANDVGRYHMRSSRAAFLKDLKSQYFEIHYPKAGALDLESGLLSEQTLATLQAGAAPQPKSQQSAVPKNGSPRAAKTGNVDLLSNSVHQRNSITDMGAGKMKSGKVTGKRNSLSMFPTKPQTERKPRVVAKLFQHERVLYDSDEDNSQKVNIGGGGHAAIPKPPPTPRTISKRLSETFQGRAPLHRLVKSKSTPITTRDLHDSGKVPPGSSNANNVAPERNTEKDVGSVSLVEPVIPPPGSPQRTQRASIANEPLSPLGNTRSAAKHWHKHHSTTAIPNVTPASAPGGVPMMPQKSFSIWSKMFSKPKPIKAEVFHLQRSVSLSELDYTETAGVSHLKKYLQPSGSGNTLSAGADGNEGDDENGGPVRRVITRSRRHRKAMIRKRRQTFPSKDNDLWKLQKLHQGVVI